VQAGQNQKLRRIFLTHGMPCGILTHMETQQIRLRWVPQDVVRIAKSKAALIGQTLEDFLTELIAKAMYKEKTNGKR
jgi:hypothetical protein